MIANYKQTLFENYHCSPRDQSHNFILGSNLSMETNVVPVIKEEDRYFYWFPCFINICIFIIHLFFIKTQLQISI